MLHCVIQCYFCANHKSHAVTRLPVSLGLTPLSVSLLGLPKSSEQAYIEFENIEAIVKTASRTKFFIEFYSTCLEGKIISGWCFRQSQD